MNEFKSSVYQSVFDLLTEREKLLSEELTSLNLSISEDTKSSAGDKYETGREMIRQEIGKVQKQHHQTKIFKQQIQQFFEQEKSSSQVNEGSLLQYGGDWLFISVSLGQVKVNDEKVFLLSKASPLGQALLGKNKLDQVNFRGKTKQIEELF